MKIFTTQSGKPITDFAKVKISSNNVIVESTCAISCAEQERLRSFYDQFSLELKYNITPRALSNNIKRHPKIKNVIAVGAGKGGVGKTSVAVNLAKSLKMTGVNVGLLDLDLYGPNIPEAMGASSPVNSDKQHDLTPIFYHGIPTISLGQVLAAEDPVLWRGPMASKIAEQMFDGADWQELDYLVVDLPPGTGDIHISVCQKLPITAAILVSTPQNVAQIDTMKAKNMFVDLNIPILGYVNNMAYFDCGNCSQRHIIFPGEHASFNINCLLDLPLLPEISLANEIDAPLSEGLLFEFDVFAFKVALALNDMSKDRNSMIPSVSVVKKEIK